MINKFGKLENLPNTILRYNCKNKQELNLTSSFLLLSIFAIITKNNFITYLEEGLKTS
jgi:hypothetical protein